MTIHKLIRQRHQRSPGVPRRIGLYRLWVRWCGLLCSLLLALPPGGRCQEQPSSYSSESPEPVASAADTQRIHALLRRADKLHQSAPDSALQLLHAALEESKRYQYRYGAANALLQAGTIYGNRGDYEQGLHAFRQALSYSQSPTPDPGSITANIYNNTGLTYYYRGEYSRAVYCYYYAVQEEIRNNGIRDIFREGTPSLVIFYNNITVLLLNNKQYEQAKYYLNLAERITQQRKLLHLEPMILVNRAALFVADELLDSAYACFERALASAQRHNHQPALRTAGYGIGEVLLKMGKPDKAIPYLETATQPSHKSSLYYASTMPLYLLGWAWLRMKAYDKAEHYLRQSLHEAEREGTLKELMNIHEKLAEVTDAQGKYSDAAKHWRTYSLLKDSLLDMETGQMINRLEVQYRTAQKDKELAEQQLIITRKNTWIWTVAATLLFLLLMLLAYARSRHRMQAKKIRILEQQREIRSLKAMMQGEERERTRIARELHDGIGGMLAAIKMHFSALRQKYGRDSPEFNDVMRLLDETGKEVHETAHNLMPDILIRHGLPDALRMYCDTINAGDRLQIELQISGDFRQLDQSFALSLYRIVQELVQNIVKHAGATHTLVQLIQRDEILSILVEDNGSGFDLRQSERGLGLKNLEYRVNVMQGTLSLQTAPGKGTLAYLEFDMNKVKTYSHE